MAIEPQIVSSYQEGFHNADLEKTYSRLSKDHAFKNLDTIIMMPAFGQVPTKAVASWMNMGIPPNSHPVRLWALGMEVGDAYSKMIEGILAHPVLSKYKYILTVEHDNIPPPDGLYKLLARMEEHPEFACIGGLYFTKGPGGCAQIWGDATQGQPLNFRPQRPDPNGGLVECCGTGMGFNLFRLDMFKDEKLRKPWFKTLAGTEGAATQDLYFWSDARKQGYRCAIDCSVKVGHYDLEGDFVW